MNAYLTPEQRAEIAKSMADDEWASVASNDRLRWLLASHEAVDARIAELEARPLWVCFHCGFETSDHAKAEAHFGDGDGEPAICVDWNELKDAEKAYRYQDCIQELNKEREESFRLRTANEGLEFRLLEFENLLGSRFKNCQSINDIFNLYDSMEGRALAAEEKLAEKDARIAELTDALQWIAHPPGMNRDPEAARNKARAAIGAKQ